MPHRIRTSLQTVGLLLMLTASVTTPAWATDQAGDSAKRLVARKASLLALLHKKARRAIVNAAQDRSYGLLASATHSHQPGGSHQYQTLKERVDRVSLNVQDNFRVEEMCLIHIKGHELSRIVNSRVAQDLSLDETGAVFFEPSLALRQRTSYRSPIYVSPDTEKLVVAYVTPVGVEGETYALLHYEHGLDYYQDAMNRGLSDDDLFLVVVDEHGLVISDSRTAISVVKRSNHDDIEDYLRPFNVSGMSLQSVLQALAEGHPMHSPEGRDYRGAFRVVDGWTLLAFAAR